MKNLSYLIVISSLFCMAAMSKAENLVDPTRPAGFVNEQGSEQVNNTDQKLEDSELQVSTEEAIEIEPEFKLNAIKIGHKTRMAIINGETLKLGDNLGAAKLINIHSSSVDMRVDGEIVSVTLLPATIKKRSSK